MTTTGGKSRSVTMTILTSKVQHFLLGRKYNTPKNRGGAKRHLWAHIVIVPLLIGVEAREQQHQPTLILIGSNHERREGKENQQQLIT
eukprot:scaffold20663_cov224-Skeletonema_marinoi.AAC.1